MPTPTHDIDLQAAIGKMETMLSKKSRGQTPLLSMILVTVAGGTGFTLLRTPEAIPVVSQAEFTNSKTAVWEKIRTMDDARIEIKTNVAVIATQVSNLTGNVDRLVGAIEKTNEKHENAVSGLDGRVRELEKMP